MVGEIACTLEVLPTTASSRADYYILVGQMAAKLRTLQQAMGSCVRASPSRTSAPRRCRATPRSSVTGAPGGINHGMLDCPTYLPTVTKARAGVGTTVNAQGRLSWVQAVGSQPGPLTVNSTNDYATGAFLLAASEVLKL